MPLPPIDDSPTPPGSAGPCPPCTDGTPEQFAAGEITCGGPEKCSCAVLHDHGPWNG